MKTSERKLSRLIRRFDLCLERKSFPMDISDIYQNRVMINIEHERNEMIAF